MGSRRAREVVQRPPSADDLVATRIRLPAVRRRLVPRRDLQRRLAHASDRALTLVQAPAGWGKTTLLRTFAHARAGRVAWVSLEESDNDPVLFWRYVVHALRTVFPGVGARFLDVVRAPGTSMIGEAMPRLLNELSDWDATVALCLDDYHVIVNPDIHGSLAYLVEHLPTSLHVMMATRSEPPLPLPRLRARGELLELRTDDLRFSGPDAATLLNDVLDLGLDLEDVERLQERTEGWVAGLCLAGLSLQGHDDPRGLIRGFGGDDRHLGEYLGAEVLQQQTDEVRDFLLTTSVLDWLSGSLCDAVTGGRGSAGLLESLHRSNVFVVALDRTGSWYRYHHLFGELLRQELGRSHPERWSELNQRAAEWYREHGFVGDAIRHAQQAGDFATAADLVAEHWNDVLNQGRLETVDAWLGAMPQDVVDDDPGLCLARAGVSLTMGRRTDVDRWLDQAEARAHLRPAGPGRTSVPAEASIYRAVHRYMLGDLPLARAAAERAVSLARDETTPWTAMAWAALGRSLHWQGDTARSEAALEQAVRHAQPPSNNLSVIASLGYLAVQRADRADWVTARAFAADALARASEHELTEHWVVLVALVAQGLVARSDGDLDAAARDHGRAVDLGYRGAGRVEMAFSLLALAQTAHMLGDDRMARRASEAARRHVERCPEPGILRPLLDRVRSVVREPTSGARPSSHEVAASDLELSERELAVLRLLRSELTLREIGSTLYVSHNTIKTHTRRIYRKLEASGRADAVRRASALGLV